MEVYKANPSQQRDNHRQWKSRKQSQDVNSNHRSSCLCETREVATLYNRGEDARSGTQLTTAATRVRHEGIAVLKCHKLVIERTNDDMILFLRATLSITAPHGVSTPSTRLEATYAVQTRVVGAGGARGSGDHGTEPGIGGAREDTQGRIHAPPVSCARDVWKDNVGNSWIRRRV